MSTCVGTQSPKYLEMAQGHISLSGIPMLIMPDVKLTGRAHQGLVSFWEDPWCFGL
jgi:hypothetical protein